MGFPTQDQGKVINRVVAVVHEHHDVIQDSGIQVLCFINGEEKRLAFFFVKIGDLFLDSLEYPGFAAFFRNSKNEAANYAQTECQFRYCGTAIPFLTVRSAAR